MAGFLAFIAPSPAVKATNQVSAVVPVWAKVKWPLPIDQWGRVALSSANRLNCGTEIALYVRTKLGSCNCTTGIADDADLDRMSYLDLVGGEVSPGRPITVAWLKGRSRTYRFTASKWLGHSAISVVFNDRCDMIVATAVLPDRSATSEPAVLEFLNGATMLHWADIALGIFKCQSALATIFQQCDVLITPSTIGEAPADLVSISSSVFNRTWTLMHVPCLTIPAYRGPNGMPVGIQVVGLIGSDVRTMAAAQSIADVLM